MFEVNTTQRLRSTTHECSALRGTYSPYHQVAVVCMRHSKKGNCKCYEYTNYKQSSAAYFAYFVISQISLPCIQVCEAELWKPVSEIE